MMTINNLYRLGVDVLNEAGKDDAEFDARCLLEYILNIDTTQFFLCRSDEIDEKEKDEYLSLLKRRITGEPLQYILGKWEFRGNEFYVGEGVLIPRPETEMLVDFAEEFLKDKTSPVVVDLCSGSGCIAISVAKLFPSAKVFAVEKYDKAFSYLKRNIKYNNSENVTAVNGDIFDKSLLNDLSPDLILSNPPYIRSSDIEHLQFEVLREPVTALDGGIDGYDFYRFLSDYWFNAILKKGSAMILECAEDQCNEIASMFSKIAQKTKIINDFNGLQRVVIAYK